MARFDLWTHGVNVVIENPTNIALEERRGVGTKIEQREDSRGWFDFPVPSPTVLDDDRPVSLRNMRLRARCNENAFLTFLAVHVDGSDRLWEEDLAPEREDGITGVIDYGLGVPRGTMLEVTGGINLCVQVNFRTGPPRGQVLFQGAGALYTT